jgi:hypothetical protein
MDEFASLVSAGEIPLSWEMLADSLDEELLAALQKIERLRARHKIEINDPIFFVIQTRGS